MPNINLQPREIAETLNNVVAEVGADWQEKVTQPLELENSLQTVYCEHTYVEDSREVENILQPYLGDFAPKGTISIGSVENTLEIGQIDMKFKASDFNKFFNTRYPNYHQAGKDPLDNDFIGDFLNDFLNKQIIRELGRLSIFGVKAARTEGVAAPFLTTFTGFDKKIADLVTAGKVGTVTTGVITKTNIGTVIGAAMESLDATIRFEKGRVKMSKTMATWYSQWYKANHPYAAPVVTDPTGKFMMVDDYQVVIEPLQCMEGLNYFIIDMEVDMKTNMIIGKHKTLPALPQLRFESDAERGVNVMGELHRFYGLRRFEYTYKSKVA
jgi:hypothetical protein